MPSCLLPSQLLGSGLSGGSGGGVGPGVDDILLETGEHLLKEDGGALLIDADVIPVAENFSGTSSNESVLLWQSTGTSLDMEVALTARINGTIYLRTAGDSGVFCNMAGAGAQCSIGVCAGISAGNNSTIATTKAAIFKASVSLATGAYTFGVAGYEVYLKKDGVKIVSFLDYHMPQVGGASLRAVNGQAVSLTCTFLAPVGTYSAFGTSEIDARDFGVKSVATTGTIANGSNLLAVANANAFSVGDPIIVEIGNEAGAGVRGTVGVGGTWPTTSYANAAARAADTSKANNTYAYEIDTGSVYRWATGSPGSWSAVVNYFSAKAVPRSLLALVTAKSGNVLTLSVNASATATNANVYYDNAHKLSNLLASKSAVNGANGNSSLDLFETSAITIRLPAETLYFGSMVRCDYTNKSVRGQGQTVTSIVGPKGTSGGQIFWGAGSGIIAQDFAIIGNVDANGFGLAWSVASKWDGADSSGIVYATNADAITLNSDTSTVQQVRGCFASGLTGATMSRVNPQNIFWMGCGFQSSNNCYIDSCASRITRAAPAYSQWIFQIADSTGGGITNCSIDSDVLIPGAELFRVTGNGVISNFTSRNASFSSNSSGNISYSGFNVTIEANKQDVYGAFSSNNPIININNNIGSGYAGNPVALSNIIITQQGVCNASNDILTGIGIALACSSVSIDTCSITQPNYVSGGRSDTAHGLSDAANTDWSNMTLTGNSVFQVNGSGNKRISNRNNSTIANGSSVTNCGTDFTLS